MRLKGGGNEADTRFFLCVESSFPHRDLHTDDEEHSYWIYPLHAIQSLTRNSKGLAYSDLRIHREIEVPQSEVQRESDEHCDHEDYLTLAISGIR